MDYTKMLFEKYGTALLKAEYVSEIIGRSVRSLEVDRQLKTGLPYKRVGAKPNSPVRYPLHVISKYLNENEKVI